MQMTLKAIMNTDIDRQQPDEPWVPRNWSMKIVASVGRILRRAREELAGTTAWSREYGAKGSLWVVSCVRLRLASRRADGSRHVTVSALVASLQL